MKMASMLGGRPRGAYADAVVVMRRPWLSALPMEGSTEVPDADLCEAMVVACLFPAARRRSKSMTMPEISKMVVAVPARALCGFSPAVEISSPLYGPSV